MHIMMDMKTYMMTVLKAASRERIFLYFMKCITTLLYYRIHMNILLAEK